jgi:hypothetical protein
MIVAVQINSEIKIVFDHIEPLRPLAILMSAGAKK